MFLSEASIKRPIAISCLIIGLSLLGFNAYRKMGLELMPKVDVPYITVVTVYPGASPEQIETDVAKRIEDQVVTIDGIKHVSSTCMENVCQTLLEFQLDVDVDIAATDVREKLDLVKADFPEDVEDPKILKFDINSKPIIHLALTGDVSLDELYDFADNTLRDRITVISGVADVELVGGAEREVHIFIDRDKLAARDLVSIDVLNAIQQGVKTIPSGRVREEGTEYSVEFDADYENMADIATLEVANHQGRRCYIRDIGRAEMTTEELREKAFINGQSCVAIKVIKKAEANAVRVVRRVREAMQKLNEQLPGGMELIWVADDGTFIEATVTSVWRNVGQGILLTVIILFLFLYNFRATIVISITMPLTIVIGFFFMQFLQYTLNTPTLLAIGMSVGVLVTNSIVVMEAIVKRLNQTGHPKEAARLGAAEAGIAVLASAGTNIVVLFPLAMMGSMIGLFIKPFAITMVIMTAVSLFISFTLTPILCSILLKPRDNSHLLLVKMESLWDRMFNHATGVYGGLLRFNEHYRLVAAAILLVVIVLLLHSFYLAGKSGFGFIAKTDQGQITIKLEYPTRYDLNKTVERIHHAEEKLKDLPHIQYMFSTVGKVEGVFGQASEGVYLGQILLKFPHRTERPESIDQLADFVRTKMADYPECIVTVSLPSVTGGTLSDIELEISGDKFENLDRLALQARQFAGEINGILDPDSNVRPGKSELLIKPNRAILADLHTPAIRLGMTLRTNLEGITAGTFKQGARNYDIVVELDERQGKQQVEQFLLPGTPGHPLLLTGLGTVQEKIIPIQITRKDKRRVSKLFANLTPNMPLGTAVQKISRAIDQAEILLPGYDYKFAGTYEIMAEGQAEIVEAGIIAVILIILTLSAILESFKQPWLILVTLPLALIGVFWALALAGLSITMFALMGVVMMIGIVVNNAILIIDQLNVHIHEGIPRHKAMISAATERFCPIVMITLAAVLGMMPLAAGRGIGAELRNDVGIASVGGILISGILTLIVVPILYDLFTRKNGRV